jgi:hypothetical protein
MSEITPVGFDCWKYGDLYSEDQVNELESRIALLEKKNADLKVELDNALGWYEKWQKIANERSKEILRLMEL